MLSNKQKELLNRYADGVLQSTENPSIVIKCNSYLNTRETGRGYPIYCYLLYPSGDKDFTHEISRVQEAYSLVSKMDEIANYLISLGVQNIERP